MSAFVIGQMEIHNRVWMDEYFSMVPSLIEKHSGKFLVRGGDPARLEGENRLPDAAFVIEFPDREHALDFWNSEEFKPLILLRQSGSSLDAIVVDGSRGFETDGHART
ncbi:MAG: DUF1330 domain-containing protein [Acidimicrobiia bacterium]|nr:DUF1330 domain-containing protein [Acidimicrobiia bacterium]